MYIMYLMYFKLKFYVDQFMIFDVAEPLRKLAKL